MSEKLFDWLYGVIARPVSTLKEVASNKPVWWGLLIYLGISLLSSLAAVFDPQVAALYEEMTRQFTFAIPALLLVFGGILISVLMLLIYVGVLHLFGRLFGGSGSYWSLFSAYTFASFPGIIGVPVTLFGSLLGVVGSILSGLVGFAISIWVIVLQVIALRESHGLSTGMAILAYFITIFVLVIIPVLLIIGLVMAFMFI